MTLTYHNKTALITGASSGIGQAFAKTLAARGTNVVLVARSQDKLQSLSTDLTQKYTIRADMIVADLTHEDAVSRVATEVQERGLTIDLLINNAGFGTYGPFASLSAEQEHAEVMLNVATVVALTHQFLPAMLERGTGAIINVSSTSAFQPVPYMAVYGATKAFILSFSEALWAEYRKHGVQVLALCPGPTATGFFDVAQGGPTWNMRTPEQAVATGLHALERGRSFVIDGRANYFQAQGARFLPRALLARISARLMRSQHNA